jgi:hypothetical protein
MKYFKHKSEMPETLNMASLAATSDLVGNYGNKQA